MKYSVTKTNLIIDKHGKSTGFKACKFHVADCPPVEIRPIQGKVLGKAVWVGERNDFQSAMTIMGGVV